MWHSIIVCILYEILLLTISALNLLHWALSLHFWSYKKKCIAWIWCGMLLLYASYMAFCYWKYPLWINFIELVPYTIVLYNVMSFVIGCTWCDIACIVCTWCEIAFIVCTWCEFAFIVCTWCEIAFIACTWCEIASLTLSHTSPFRSLSLACSLLSPLTIAPCDRVQIQLAFSTVLCFKELLTG